MVAGCIKSCNCRGKESSGLLWGLSILEALIQYFQVDYTEVAARRNLITIERVRFEKKASLTPCLVFVKRDYTRN